MPAATTVTRSSAAPPRTMRLPPIGNSSSGRRGGRLLTRGPDVRDAAKVGHRCDELRGLVRVAGIQDGAAVHRAHHREVLECHLGRTVLADRDARVRTGEADVRVRDRGHSDEVVRAGEERRERRCEGDEADHLHPYRDRDHALLRDVHLEEAVGGRLLEVLGVRRVAHLGIEDHDVRRGRTERRERLPICLARRKGLGVLLEIRRLGRRDGAGCQSAGSDVEGVRRLGADLREGLLRLLGSSASPCQPGLSSMNETPLPFTVRAMIAVGRDPERARPNASSISSRSWPSMTIASQPNAFARAAYASVSHSSSVGPR